MAAKPRQKSSLASRDSSSALALSLEVELRILDRYQNPLFVIDQERNLLFRNEIAARVMRANGGFLDRGGKLLLGYAADGLLQDILTGAKTVVNGVSSSCRGIRVMRPGSPKHWLVLIHPLDQLVRDESAPRLFLLQAVGRTRPRIMPAAALHDLFGLTGREIAVVEELLRSDTVETAAKRLSLSRETVRSHLKSAFRKCEVNSKAELASLLQCVSRFAAAP